MSINKRLGVGPNNLRNAVERVQRQTIVRCIDETAFETWKGREKMRRKKKSKSNEHRLARIRLNENPSEIKAKESNFKVINCFVISIIISSIRFGRRRRKKRRKKVERVPHAFLFNSAIVYLVSNPIWKLTLHPSPQKWISRWIESARRRIRESHFARDAHLIVADWKPPAEALWIWCSVYLCSICSCVHEFR